MRLRMETTLPAIGLILIVMGSGLSGASEYAFGTKVMPGESDIGRQLNDFFSPAVGATVMMWDIGPNPGFYDQEDVLYLVQNPPPTTTTANTIRLTPFEDCPAGSKVTPKDKDIGMPLGPIPNGPGAFIILDLYSTSAPPDAVLSQYDIDDPVYWHRIGGTTRTNDVRLSTISENYGLVAGTKLNNFDPDHFKPIRLLDVWQTLPAPAPSWLKYYDANGNGIYDYPDDVYLVRPIPPPGPAALQQVTVNSVRLSGPAA